jgi:hypothetical protein
MTERRGVGASPLFQSDDHLAPSAAALVEVPVEPVIEALARPTLGFRNDGFRG